MKHQFKKHLSIPGLLETSRKAFSKVSERDLSSKYSLVDCLMCGMAIFGMKYASLLKFNQDMRSKESEIKSNLRLLYQVGKALSDTCLRERLDDIDYLELRPAFNVLLSALQRGKALE